MQGLRGALQGLLALLFGVVCALAPAQDLQPVPALSARVVDTTATLSAAQRQAIEARLAAFEAEAGTQIVVLVVARTAPEDIAAYAQRVAAQWQVGRRDVGDGMLILWVKDERKLRIEVAKALEGAVPDLAARQIIDQRMKPLFQQADYAGGLAAAIDALAARISGEQLPAPSPRQAARGGLPWGQLAIFLFVAVPVLGRVLGGLLGRKAGTLLTAGAIGGLGWWLTTSVVLGLGAGVLALVAVGLMGVGSVVRGTGLASALGSHRGGLGAGFAGGFGGAAGWGGERGGGGGFASGGGGDFGGGGASGDY